jgi:hypothetical protein
VIRAVAGALVLVGLVLEAGIIIGLLAPSW